MATHKVLLTDYVWPDLGMERAILTEVDAELIVAENQDQTTLQALAKDADAILTCWAKVSAAVLDAAPNCRIVSRLGIGLDNVDVACCTRRGIPVTNVPDYCSREVAEHAMALIFSLARHTAFFHHKTQSGQYDLQAAAPPRRLKGQTLGIVGFGNIGRELASLADAIGLQVIVHTRTASTDAACVELSELLQRSDFISLHVPLTKQTEFLIDARALAQMKATAFLINTARGGLIDHAALAAALERGNLAGAGLDVQTPEPPDLSQAPYNHPYVIVTPHSAFVSVESVAELRRRATENVASRLGGKALNNVVNIEALS